VTDSLYIQVKKLRSCVHKHVHNNNLKKKLMLFYAPKVTA